MRNNKELRVVEGVVARRGGHSYNYLVRLFDEFDLGIGERLPDVTAPKQIVGNRGFEDVRFDAELELRLAEAAPGVLVKSGPHAPKCGADIWPMLHLALKWLPNRL